MPDSTWPNSRSRSSPCPLPPRRRCSPSHAPQPGGRPPTPRLRRRRCSLARPARAAADCSRVGARAAGCWQQRGTRPLRAGGAGAIGPTEEGGTLAEVTLQRPAVGAVRVVRSRPRPGDRTPGCPPCRRVRSEADRRTASAWFAARVASLLRPPRWPASRPARSPSAGQVHDRRAGGRQGLPAAEGRARCESIGPGRERRPQSACERLSPSAPPGRATTPHRPSVPPPVPRPCRPPSRCGCRRRSTRAPW